MCNAKFYLFSLLLFIHTPSWSASNNQVIKIAYVIQELPAPVALSNLDVLVPNKGISGAELAISDNNTTGEFTGQKYVLKTINIPLGADVVETYKKQIDNDTNLILLAVNAEQLLKLTDLTNNQQKLWFDVATSDDELRNGLCRHQVLHILPSRAMRADALAQYMLKKRWQKWFLVTGQSPADQLYAQAIKRAAKHFGMKIVAEKSWTNNFDSRRTAQSDVPEFTQGVDYDVLVVADEEGVFGEYLDYRTWSPRPVIGTQGLIATAWHKTHELWGATQLQNRFRAFSGRGMEEQDYAAYIAVRAIGEASLRTKSNQMQSIKDYLLSNTFALQGYKGVPLSFRAWDGQLRQPVLLAAPRELVSVAPLDGFLHPKTELDTLGYDQPETSCK
ncbi:ABC transporter substrate-binding protein [Methylomonas sp. AM2-LC]|uniref:ABC transporter substrate-binding protein n=1 Tax=Methylomonas sp. AM2-LC TaxID=3153301 RepID=UPI003263AB90